MQILILLKMANSTETGEVESVPTEATAQEEKCETQPVATANADDDDEALEKVEFKVIFNKKKHDVTFPLDHDVGALKSHLQPLIGITPAMM